LVSPVNGGNIQASDIIDELLTIRRQKIEEMSQGLC
jgi:hypothetical protein